MEDQASSSRDVSDDDYSSSESLYTDESADKIEYGDDDGASVLSEISQLTKLSRSDSHCVRDLKKLVKTMQEKIDRVNLTHEVCDFLADFGRSEIFLLDGDALIAHCLDNEFLDWENGTQYLHLAYLFEDFLAKLHCRGANFHLFFLADNDAIFARRGPSYALGRAVLMRHTKMLAERYTDTHPVVVHIVQGSWLTANPHSAPTASQNSWKALLQNVRPCFIMSNNISVESLDFSIAQHWFVHRQLLSRHHLVLLDNLDFEGSRIWGFLFCPPQSTSREIMRKALAEMEGNIEPIFGDGLFFEREMKQSLPPVVSKATVYWKPSLVHGDDLRSVIYLRSIQSLFHAECTSVWKGLALVTCLKLSVMESMSLTERSLTLPCNFFKLWKVSSLLKDQLTEYLHKLKSALTESVKGLEEDHSFTDGNFLDIFDGRLFFVLLCYSISGASPSDLVVSRCHRFFSSIFPGEGIDFSAVPMLLRVSSQDVRESENFLNEAIAAKNNSLPLEAPRQVLRPLDENETLLSAVLGDVKSCMKWLERDTCTPDFALRRFIPHHYHSTRPLDNEPDCCKISLELRQQRFNTTSGPQQVNKSRIAWRKEQRLLKQKQLKARASVRYQVSLLYGQPVQPQTIAEKQSAEEFARRKREACLSLSTDAENIERNGKSKQIKSNKATHKTKAQTIIEKNEKRISSEKAMKAKQQFENLKVSLRGKDTLEYLSEMEALSNTLQKDNISEVALDVKMHCLECSMAITDQTLRKKTCYVSAQSLLRSHANQLQDEQKQVIGEILRAQGFFDFADLLGAKQGKAKMGRASKIAIEASSIRFQLACVPEHLVRPAGVEADKRVSFPPDHWQRRLLDVVDSGNSALVIAPTASGKTFISYYVMEQCLRLDDDSVVVYLAPTKALVNQVRAEIEARFSKNYSGARSVAATFTRDFRDENMLNCQILVTVPECLNILLLSGANLNWVSRIRHVIFDEVHCLGDAGGEVWEQLLLLIETPFLALSATLGETHKFYEWLKKVEESRGRQLYLVEHHDRYNDLFNWVWSSEGRLIPLNPFWAIQPGDSTQPISSDRFPKAIRILPEHCVGLYEAMSPFLGDGDDRVNPESFFRKIREDALWNISMKDARAWEAALIQEFCNLSARAQSTVTTTLAKETAMCFDQEEAFLAENGQMNYVRERIAQLLHCLKKQEMLPAICFMLNRSGCETLARIVARDLQSQETESRKSRPAWIQKLEKLERAFEEAKKHYELHCKDTILITPTGEEINNAKDCYEKLCEVRTKLRQHLAPEDEHILARLSDDDIEEAFSNSSSQAQLRPWTSVVPPYLQSALRRGIGVHHAGLSKEYRQGVERLFRMKKLGVVFATSTLALGINMPAKTSVFVADAIYLNGMNFRQMSGRAGRRGFDLRGHVVFFGTPSSKCCRLIRSELPKLQGNLLFSNSLALRLLMRQSALREQRPVDNERLRRAVLACARLVNMPLFNPLAAHARINSEECQQLLSRQMAHCFRFSVEYLLRCGLLRRDGTGELEPNDLAGFVAHLFYMEPSNFAFLTLLTTDGGRLLQRLCTPAADREEKVVAILCHLFCRRKLPRSIAKSVQEAPASFGPSKVLLPPLSKIGDLVKYEMGSDSSNDANVMDNVGGSAGFVGAWTDCGRRIQTIREGRLIEKALHKHNGEALKALVDYCAGFVATYQDKLGPDNRLPFSDLPCGGQSTVSVQTDQDSRSILTNESAPSSLHQLGSLGQLLVQLGSGPGNGVRSRFVMLSGHSDKFKTVEELCATARSGFYMDPKMAPIFEIQGDWEKNESPSVEEESADSASTSSDGLTGGIGSQMPATARGHPLNAYLLDFFKHGQRSAICEYNGIRDDVLWDQLKDFGLLLKALWAAMERRSTWSKGGFGGAHTNLFDHPDVLSTFKAIYERFEANLRDQAA